MIRPRQIARYKAFKRRLIEAGFKQYRLHKELGIPKSAVSNFFAYRRNKLSKRYFLLIYHWLIEHGIIIVRSRPRHKCRDCDNTHAIKSQKESRSEQHTQNAEPSA